MEDQQRVPNLGVGHSVHGDLHQFAGELYNLYIVTEYDQWSDLSSCSIYIYNRDHNGQSDLSSCSSYK